MRAPWHDYHSPSVYMVTFGTIEGIGRLSAINGKICDSGIDVILNKSRIGLLIEQNIKTLPEEYPHLEIWRWCIMPDHIHILLCIKETTAIHLGTIIGKLKAKCSRAYWEEFSKSEISLNRIGIFHEGFNDRIIFGDRKVETFKNYIDKNPFRHFVRRNAPRFFNSCRKIIFNTKEYSIYGNFLLLQHPEKSAVRYSSKYSESEFAKLKSGWNEIARGRGVLVSPFIHPEEKRIRDKALEKGVSIIRIVNNGFPERYKPQGKEFDLCAEGRLLLIAPAFHNTRAETIKRAECMEMNALAEEIAKAEGSARLLGALKELRNFKLNPSK